MFEECRAQRYFPAHSNVDRREEAGANYRGPAVLNGAQRLEYAARVSVFLASIGCNLVVIGLVDGICGQRPSCVLRCPLRFLTFPLPGGPEPSPGSPALAPQHNSPQNCKNLFLNSEQRFHPRGRYQSTRCQAQNRVTFHHHGCAARTINLAVLFEVIWNVYEANDTLPTYTVFTREKYVTCHLTQHNAGYKLASHLGRYL